jgi:hypothetical protein
MPNPYRHLFDESSRQQSERTKLATDTRLGDVDLMVLKEQREKDAQAHALEKKSARSKLKELIYQHPGIGRDEILKLGGYRNFPEKEFKFLKQVRAIEWRKDGYFVREIKAEGP